MIKQYTVTWKEKISRKMITKVYANNEDEAIDLAMSGTNDEIVDSKVDKSEDWEAEEDIDLMLIDEDRP